tara:strand:- start:3692 stop:4816 length:1125 start_codon:yes stop_codon:yes gene_type:complete
MNKVRIGLVTAWGECGMGYVARNWIYTFNKFSDQISYQIYSRSFPWLMQFRWQGPNVINGPNQMDIDHPHFWNWVEDFKPDILLFQDQNIFSKSKMKEETYRLKKMGIKLINYPDWIKRGDIEKYKGLYDINLSHVKRNYNWLVEANVENPTFIPWGVIIKNFPFIERKINKRIKFYINIGTGTIRKGYPLIPKALEKMKGNLIQRYLHPKYYDYDFIATAINNSKNFINKSFIKYFNTNPQCELIFKTANNEEGGNYCMGDVYIYPTTKEGIGLTITESMCSGMPVVTSNYPTMNEWLDDNKEGRLIKPAKIKRSSMPMDKVIIDTNHLAEIMIDYIEHPKKVTEHSMNARKKIETEFNWDDRDTIIMNTLLS